MISIVGLGTWLPEEVRGNDAWPSSFGERSRVSNERIFNDIPESDDPEAARILERDLAAEALDPFLGAKRRHVASASESAYDGESMAARRALEDAGIAASDVDFVLGYAVVGEHPMLGSATTVAHRIGAHKALAFCVEATCASAVVQLELARSLLESGRARVILLTQSHLLLRATSMLHPATPGLGDAASAMVLTRGPGLSVRATRSVSHGEFAEAVVWRRGPEEPPRWWQGGSPLRLGTYDMDGVKYLMRETVAFGARTVSEAAALAEIAPNSIDVLASVQPRGFIPGAIAERLGLPRERAVTTYDDIAHVGACGPVMNLVRARELGRLQPGARVALYAQGAGFTRAAGILEVTSDRFAA